MACHHTGISGISKSIFCLQKLGGSGKQTAEIANFLWKVGYSARLFYMAAIMK